MSDITKLTALQMADALADDEFTSVELVEAHLERIEKLDGELNTYLFVNTEGALKTAQEVDKARAAGEDLPRFAGVPIAIKDMLVTKDQPTTAASKMLEGWMSPYDATVVEAVRAEKMPILGKNNMDEFAMGATTEFSAFGPTKNPWDTTRHPGGSGGGSAAAVAAYLTPWAIGTDTGGSVREPAAYTGTVGVKPTYGAIPRYGCIGMASSLDTIGPAARTTADAAALQQIIGGHDPKDSTSLVKDWSSLLDAAGTNDLTGIKIGVNVPAEGFAPEVWEVFTAAIETLKSAGADVVEIETPLFAYAKEAYYLLMPAEVSSNLAKFDGVRYGNRVVPENPTIDAVMSATRAAGFGDEVKRRIILGTYVLSAGYYDAYYASAQKVRTLVQRQYEEAFASVDALISPTTPKVASKLGVQLEDPTTMYTTDMVAITSNMAGVPAISVPAGIANEMPVGLHIQAPAYKDEMNYRIASAFESALDTARGCAFHTQIETKLEGAK